LIDSATRSAIVARAANRCEYCLLPQAAYEATFHIDHIVSSQHRPDDRPENLALSCPKCNRKKGPNLVAIDPGNQAMVRLFNPRTDAWTEHFRWNGPLLAGLTPCGRATVALLDLNQEERDRLRQSLIAEGNFPPSLKGQNP
jgi:hypothetical protein